MRLELFHFEDDTLDLGREDVDTPYYEHIVAAAYDAAHTHVGTSARARFIGQRTEVFGPVAQQRHPLFGQRRENQLPLLAVRQRFQRIGRDDLGQKMIFYNVRPVLAGAFVRHPRPHDFA